MATGKYEPAPVPLGFGQMTEYVQRELRRIGQFINETAVAGAPVGASYVTVDTEASLSNERRLSATAGLVFRDRSLSGYVLLDWNMAALTARSASTTELYLLAYDVSASAHVRVPVNSLPTNSPTSVTGIVTEILQDVPTAYWKFNESAGTQIFDYGSGSYTLSQSGSHDYLWTYIPPNDITDKYVRIGSGAVNFNRGDALGLTPPLTASWALEMSVLLLDATTTMRLFSIGGVGETEAANLQVAALITASGLPRIFWESGAGVDTDISISFSLVVAQAYHFVFNKDPVAKTLTFFINGRKTQVVSYTNDPTGGGSSVTRVGQDGVSNTGRFGMAHLAFYYGKVLSDARIVAHARALGFY